MDQNTIAYFNAISKLDIATCRSLLNANVNVNCRNKNWTGLLIAVWHGSLPLTQLLVSSQADVNLQQYDKSTPLYIACQKGFVPIIKMLLDHNANVNIPRECGATPLYIAAQEGKEEAVKLLLEHKANPDSVRADGSGPFYISCRCNFIGITRLLVNSKANVNLSHPKSGSGLYIACQQEHVELVKYLLTIPSVKVNQKAFPDDYPLHVACKKKNYILTQLLLNHGAAIDITNNGGEVNLISHFLFFSQIKINFKRQLSILLCLLIQAY